MLFLDQIQSELRMHAYGDNRHGAAIGGWPQMKPMASTN